MMRLSLFAASAVVALAGRGTAQIVQFTFEGQTVVTPSGSSSGNYLATSGTGMASGFHASSSTSWSLPTGNGSNQALNSTQWHQNDYWQFQVATNNAPRVQVQFDQTRSSSGPSAFDFRYSTDGTTFTSAGFGGNGAYTVGQAVWATDSTSSSSTVTPDLSAIDFSGFTTLYFRLVETASITANTSSNRVDNFTVTPVPEPAGVLAAAAAAGLCLARLRRPA